MEPQQCVECAKILCNQYSLARHVQACHRKLRAHICEICGKRLCSKQYLLMHRARHLANQPTGSSSLVINLSTLGLLPPPCDPTSSAASQAQSAFRLPSILSEPRFSALLLPKPQNSTEIN